jgi:hypothetical protein
MFQENLDIFLKDFGSDVYIGGSSTSIKAILDEVFYNPQLKAFDFSIQKPTLTAKEIDFKDIEKGTAIIIDNKTYYLVKATPDGTGTALISLSLNK